MNTYLSSGLQFDYKLRTGSPDTTRPVHLWRTMKDQWTPSDPTIKPKASAPLQQPDVFPVTWLWVYFFALNVNVSYDVEPLQTYPKTSRLKSCMGSTHPNPGCIERVISDRAVTQFTRVRSCQCELNPHGGTPPLLAKAGTPTFPVQNLCW